jgi:hypothetical protein
VFTLERREGPASSYRIWAIAVIEPGSTNIALRLKAPDGQAFPSGYPLDPGGAERFFAEDLPQLGRVDGEVTRNTPSIYFVITEIHKQFKVQGVGVFRGRVKTPLHEIDTAEQRAERAADVEFAARSADMSPMDSDALPR